MTDRENNKPGEQDSTDAADDAQRSDSAAPESPGEHELDDAADAVDVVDEQDDTDASENSAKPRRSIIGVFAFLLALIALGLVLYLGWRVEFAPEDQTIARLTRAVSDLDERVDTTADRAEVALADAVDVMSARIEQQQDALTIAENAMAEAVANQRNLEPPSAREWKLAEVEYLLRVANHRLLMERDAASALTLTRAADQILEELGDFAYHEVRALLADEQMSLARLRDVDIQGIFLRLEAIKNQVAELPIRLPQYVAQENVAVPDDTSEPSTLDLLTDRLFGLVEIRRHEGLGVRPLLAPDEAMYLEQNLRLALERTQLAALRQDQVMYEVSLESIRSWLIQYVNQDEPIVGVVYDEIEALLAISLSRELPDISRSLRRLQQLRRVEAGVPQ